MRTKIIVLDDHFSTGEPTVQPVLLWGLRGKPFYGEHSKVATHSPAMEYIKTVTPVPGRTIVLIIGLGSFEYYGLNRNGDGFNERPYKPNVKPTCGCCGTSRDAWVLEDECVQHHYKTYEQGAVYRHHCNKDPKKAIGQVLKAFWNPYMHRVEVLQDIENTKAPDLVEQINGGQYPAASMGCRIKYDVCTKCGHNAPTRAQYCDHLKWQMGHLDPGSGIRYGALNPSPRFFDSSWVIRPADRTGYMLKKVANTHAYELQDSSVMGELVDALDAKSAAVRKIGAIDKVLRGYPAAMVSSDLPEGKLVEQYRDTSLSKVTKSTELLPEKVLQALSMYSLPKTLKALSRAGITLTTPEFVKLFMKQLAPQAKIPVEVLHHLTALQTEILALLAEHPTLLEALSPALQTEDEPGDALQKKTDTLREKRSTAMGYLQRRMTPEAYKHSDPPRTELLHVQDPTTGQIYQTNRDAVRNTEDSLDEAQLKKLLGSAGLMAGAYKALTSLPGASKLVSLPLAGASYALGRSGLQEPDTYETTTGERIPQLTELQEKQSHVLNQIHTTGLEHSFLTKHACRTHGTLHALLSKIAHFGIESGGPSLLDLLPKTAGQYSVVATPPNIEKIAMLVGNLIYSTIDRN